MQYLLNKVFEENSAIDHIYLDVDGYRQRQQAQFLRPFLSIFQKVRSEGKPYTLEPLNASERRIIHKYIEKQKDLSTLTIGEGTKNGWLYFLLINLLRKLLFIVDNNDSKVSITPKSNLR